MDRLDQMRLVQNRAPEDSARCQELEFENYQEFTAWLEIEKNQVVWNKHDTRGRREQPGVTRRATKIEWTERYRCPFSGKKRASRQSQNPHRKRKDSMKVGCTANIKAKKYIDSDRIKVTFDARHVNHEPNSVGSWQRQRLSPVVKTWLKKVVTTGINWETYKSVMKPDFETLAALESGALASDSPVAVPQMLRVSNQQFNDYRRSHLKSVAQVDSDCGDNLDRNIPVHQGPIRQTSEGLRGLERPEEVENIAELDRGAELKSQLLDAFNFIMPIIDKYSQFSELQKKHLDDTITSVQSFRRSFEASRSQNQIT
ncbi:hypothetical protein EPUL_003388 [Erysiphe pulchra]|uniref:Uncharacterized protein n=1 Tax=Erysiphe pulchra TaxID=225359 RepID=A0A2S4PUS1_9PEZI|nr:hypothetical protein EPUL_003388 [Erysiphe pulchra]